MTQKNFLIITITTLLAAVGGTVLLFKNQELSMLKHDQTTMNNDLQKIDGFNGSLLAGRSSPYLNFNKTDYDKALNSDKIIFLNFYANWCPICRAEQPDLHEGFNSLTTDEVVGFQVNYNDTETDDDEKKLAEEFEIPYQHTKVILKNGKKVLGPETVQWTSEEFLQEINKHLK